MSTSTSYSEPAVTIYRRPAKAKAAPRTPPTAGRAIGLAAAEDAALLAEAPAEAVLLATELVALEALEEAELVTEAIWLLKEEPCEARDEAAEPVAVEAAELTELAFELTEERTEL